MAHFYGDIQGNRGQATRMGTPNSGLRGHLRGWDVGVKAFLRVNAAGNDEVQVYASSGPNGGRGDVYICTITTDGIEVADSLKGGKDK